MKILVTEPPALESVKHTQLAEGQDQSCLVDFLSTPEAWGGEAVRRIDTHISHVFLVGSKVYKLKRAVQLEFVDFSSLESRRLACEREVTLNRQTAPEIYLGVVAVVQNGKNFQINGSGQPIDWLVEMMRFDDDTLFNRLVVTKALGRSLISDLGEQIARFHLSAKATARYGGTKGVNTTLKSIHETLRQFCGSVFEPAKVDEWWDKTSKALAQNLDVLETRRQSGFVRQCHGDMHLGNICLFKGRPTLFDAIEFREDFSYIDVLYDVAFPIMDLLRYKKPMLANALMNRYLEITGDYSGLSLLPLFMSMRAAVRAMVHALETQCCRNGAQDQDLAQVYFEQALSLIAPQHPRLVAFGGYSGTGKSSIARRLAVKLASGPGAIILRSDAVRKRLFQQAVLVPLPKQAYTKEVSARVYRAMFRDAHRALSSGCVVFVDATFIDSERRDTVANFAEKKGVPFQGLWLEAPEAVLIERVNARRGDVSDATSKVVKAQISRSPEPINWTRINTEGDFKETIAKAHSALS